MPFKRDTGLTKGMPYINMREWKEGFGMIQTVSKNFDNSTGEENERAKLTCKTQSMAANPPDERFKNIVSGTSINN